jgi:hypothetical protein
MSKFMCDFCGVKEEKTLIFHAQCSYCERSRAIFKRLLRHVVPRNDRKWKRLHSDLRAGLCGEFFFAFKTHTYFSLAQACP